MAFPFYLQNIYETCLSSHPGSVPYNINLKYKSNKRKILNNDTEWAKSNGKKLRKTTNNSYNRKEANLLNK